MLFVLVISAISAFELINILWTFSPNVLKTFLGYAVYLEIFFSVLLTMIAASTGAISAVAIASVTGFVITLTLISAKKLLGYRKLKRINGKFQWVEYPGTSDSFTIGIALRDLVETIGKKAIIFSKGFITKRA